MNIETNTADVWKSNLVSDAELTDFLAARGKKKSWMHLLNNRFKLMPKGIVLPGVTYLDKKIGLKIARGKSVVYPKAIEGYLEKIIHLNEAGKTYNDISKMSDIIEEREVLQKLIDADLFNDHRIMDVGAIGNFRIALKFLKKKLFWADDHPLAKETSDWEEARRRLGKIYFDCSKKMMEFAAASGDAYQKLKTEKDRVGRELDFYNALMGTVTKQGVQLLKDGLVSQGEWMREVVMLDQ